jgi:hypothetical protein
MHSPGPDFTGEVVLLAALCHLVSRNSPRFPVQLIPGPTTQSDASEERSVDLVLLRLEARGDENRDQDSGAEENGLTHCLMQPIMLHEIVLVIPPSRKR